MALILMLNRLHSTANERVKARMPAWLAAKADPLIMPRSANSEIMLTTRPDSALAMRGKTCWEIRNVALVLRVWTASHSSAPMSSRGRANMLRWSLTRMSTLSWDRSNCSMTALALSGTPASITAPSKPLGSDAETASKRAWVRATAKTLDPASTKACAKNGASRPPEVANMAVLPVRSYSGRTDIDVLLKPGFHQP